MPKEIKDVTEVVNEALGHESPDEEMNGVLVNYYPDGGTNLNAHSDFTGAGYDIASLSVGADRQFVVRDKAGEGEKSRTGLTDGTSGLREKIMTQPGQLIVMRGKTFQQKYVGRAERSERGQSVRNTRRGQPRAHILIAHHQQQVHARDREGRECVGKANFVDVPSPRKVGKSMYA